MSSLLDLLLAATDPITAILIGGVYLRIRSLTDRISRLENVFIATDGGEPVEED